MFISWRLLRTRGFEPADDSDVRQYQGCSTASARGSSLKYRRIVRFFGIVSGAVGCMGTKATIFRRSHERDAITGADRPSSDASPQTEEKELGTIEHVVDRLYLHACIPKPHTSSGLCCILHDDLGHPVPSLACAAAARSLCCCRRAVSRRSARASRHVRTRREHRRVRRAVFPGSPRLVHWTARPSSIAGHIACRGR
jgi:hypothetical protein